MLYFAVVVLFGSDLLGIHVGLGPGLSIKNAVIYGLFMLLVLRAATQRRSVIELPALHGAFFGLIAYSIASATIILVIVRYPGYDLASAIISLKARLGDQFLFFAVFFYGVHTTEDAIDVSRALLLCVTAVTAVIVVEGAGLLHLGLTQTWRGRVWALLPGPNECGSYIATMLPAIAMAASGASRSHRVFW